MTDLRGSHNPGNGLLDNTIAKKLKQFNFIKTQMSSINKPFRELNTESHTCVYKHIQTRTSKCRNTHLT